ncbi:MAG: ABC transporter permease, partial [Thermomicrobiales bacterium]
MEQFFGVSVAHAGVALGLALAVIVVTAVLLGSRRAPLLKLAARNVPRRPARALLIVVGLTLATTVFGAASGTGDTITTTLRSLVTATLGTTDEIVALNPPRPSATGQLQALAGGTFGGVNAAALGFFPQSQYDRIRDVARGSPAIAAVLPGIADQVTVIHGDTQQLRTAVGLLAIPTPGPAFGDLRAGDGSTITLEALRPDDVVLNAAAAGTFGASAGDALQIRTADTSDAWNVHIAAVTPNGGIAGSQPLIITALATYQRVIGRAGEVNQILVVNRGGSASVTNTAAAASDLRGALANREAAQFLHDYLAQTEHARALAEAESQLQGRDRANLVALRVEASKPELTDRFVSLAADPRLRRQLFALAQRLPNPSERRAVLTNLRNLTTLSVVEVKQEGLDRADQYGSVVTTVFLVLGVFSLGASLLLIYLVFVLLAADRGAELATLRALGLGQMQILGLFLIEGLIYDLLGAALGSLAGIAATSVTVHSLASALRAFGFDLTLQVAPGGILITFAIGALVTFAAMCVAAWRVSHTQIVAATRGEARTEGRGAGLAGGVALVLAAAWVWWRWREPLLPYEPRHPAVAPGALALLVLGLTCGLTWALGQRQTARAARTAGALGTGAGFLLAGLWLRTLIALPTPGGDTRTDAITAALAGLALIAASVWTVTRALGPLLRWFDRGLAPLARLRLLVRPAAGYLSGNRWRTGLTVTMFGLVVFIMVASLALIETLVDAYTARETPVAGFALRGDLPTAAANPLDDLPAALAPQPNNPNQAIRRDAFAAIGGITPLDAEIVQLGLPRAAWQSATLVAADGGFLNGVKVPFESRAPGYRDDAAVWQALWTQPGLAVVTGSTAASFLTVPEGRGAALTPFTVWARPANGGTPVKLT